MANKKIDPKQRKVPFNLSIPYVTKHRFEQKCIELDVDKNVIAWSLFNEYLLSFNTGELENIKDRGKIKNHKRLLKNN